MTESGAFRVSRAVSPPHGGNPVYTAGAPIEKAKACMILVHGRGGSPHDIMELRHQWAVDGLAFVAPQAADSTWYPLSFLSPIEKNEPNLTSALQFLAALVGEVNDRGLPSDRIVILGFSQGGCLSLEFGAENARRWGGLVGLSAGLIGPPGRPWKITGSLEGTPVLLGCSDFDPHIPEERVHDSAKFLETIGGVVDSRIYPGLGHAINQDEILRVRSLLEGILST